MNRIVKLMRCVVFAAALYAGSLSEQQVTPAMIQRAKAMGATQEQIDAALAERNERSGRPSSTQAQGSEERNDCFAAVFPLIRRGILARAAAKVKSIFEI